MANTPRDQLFKLMSKLECCMFTTQRNNGLRARPMTTIVRGDNGDVVMLSSRDSARHDEIHDNTPAVLTYSDGSRLFVSLSGTARISTDRALIREIWNPGAQAFWPHGPDDPRVVAIIVTPTEGEYWEGDNTFVSTVKFAYALAAGQAPDLGDRTRVTLSRV